MTAASMTAARVFRLRCFLLLIASSVSARFADGQPLDRVSIGMPSLERARRDQQVKEAVPVGKVVEFGALREALHELGMR